MTLSRRPRRGRRLHGQLHERRRSRTRTSAPARPVSVTGISISGTDAGNYTFNTTAIDDGGHHGAGADGDGDRREQGLRRHDDGDGDAVATTASRRRASPTATRPRRSRTRTSAPARPVSVSGISISGTDAGNYTFNTTASHDGRHHGAGADGHGDRREQGLRRHDDGDGDAVATTASRGDVFTDSYTTATFANKNVGTGKTVSVTRDLDQRARTPATTRSTRPRRRPRTSRRGR